MAKYRVEMVEFKCLDESGLDFLGSDEVMFGCASYRPKKKRSKLLHRDTSREYGDIDTGDARNFGTRVGPCKKKDRRDPHCRKMPGAGVFFDEKELQQAGLLWNRMRYPEATPAGGASAPFLIVVTGVEADRGDAKSIKKDLDNLASAIEELALVTGNSIEVPPEAVSKLSKLLGNDAIGMKSLNFSKSDLRRLLPDVGDFYFENVVVSGGDDGDIPLTGGGEYRVKLLVSRLS